MIFRPVKFRKHAFIIPHKMGQICYRNAKEVVSEEAVHIDNQSKPEQNVVMAMNQPLMPDFNNLPQEIVLEEVQEFHLDDKARRKHEKLRNLGWDTTPDNPKYNTDLQKESAEPNPED